MRFLKTLIRRKDHIGAALSRMDELTGEEEMEVILQTWGEVIQLREQGVLVLEELKSIRLSLTKRTFSTSATHKCHVKSTSHTTSRQRKQIS